MPEIYLMKGCSTMIVEQPLYYCSTFIVYNYHAN